MNKINTEHNLRVFVTPKIYTNICDRTSNKSSSRDIVSTET